MSTPDGTLTRRVSQTLRTWELVLMSALIVVALSDAVDVAFTNTTGGTTGGVREIDWRLSEHGPQRHIAAMIEERRRSLEEMKEWLTRRLAAQDGHRHLAQEGGATRPSALPLACLQRRSLILRPQPTPVCA